MGKRVLMQGNEACVEGAIAAGMRLYAGYPITPSTEIAELSAKRLPQVGGKFIQMEDEIASIACIIGGSVAGTKAMTATSGPGFSLMQENLGYAAMTETPLVIVNVQRVGPSTGMPTSPSQGDVMMTRWGTHGDHPIIVVSPSSVEETYTLIIRAFNLAEKYSTPVIFLTDEIIGHLREGVELPKPGEYEIATRTTTPFGCGKRYNVTGLMHNDSGFPTNSNAVAASFMDRLMHKISDNYDDIVSCEQLNTEDADVAIVCYGGTMRAARSAMEALSEKGVKCGIFRPITIWPFPERELLALSKKVRKIVVVEHNYGQILLEVQRIVKDTCKVGFIGRCDGTVITPEEIISGIEGE